MAYPSKKLCFPVKKCMKSPDLMVSKNIKTLEIYFSIKELLFINLFFLDPKYVNC